MKTQMLTVLFALGFATSAFAQQAPANRTINGDELTPYKEAVLAVLPSRTLKCGPFNRSQAEDFRVIDVVWNADSGGVFPGVQPLLTFTQEYGCNHGTCARKLYITTDATQKKVVSVRSEILFKVKVNDGDLQNPKMRWDWQAADQASCF